MELPDIPQRDVNPNEVLRCVAQSYLVSIEHLLGTGRLKHIAEARQVSYWLLRTRTSMSFPEIGRVLGKDHTTVMAGVSRIVRRRANEPSFGAFTDKLAEAVEARLRKEVAA